MKSTSWAWLLLPPLICTSTVSQVSPPSVVRETFALMCEAHACRSSTAENPIVSKGAPLSPGLVAANCFCQPGVWLASPSVNVTATGSEGVQVPRSSVATARRSNKSAPE
jgi:hypothetical protein